MNKTLLKLGGSLLDLPDVADRLLALLHRERISQAVIVVGGGPAADLIRNYDAQFQLSADASHRLAIEAMALNANLFTELHADFSSVADPQQLQRHAACVTVIDPVSMLATLEAHLKSQAAVPKLAPSWDTTSDSIAAWICQQLGIPKLVLLKSADVPTVSLADGIDRIQALNDQQLVDHHFQDAARDIPRIDWCNLRTAPTDWCVTSLR